MSWILKGGYIVQGFSIWGLEGIAWPYMSQSVKLPQRCCVKPLSFFFLFVFCENVASRNTSSLLRTPKDGRTIIPLLVVIIACLWTSLWPSCQEVTDFKMFVCVVWMGSANPVCVTNYLLFPNPSTTQFSLWQVKVVHGLLPACANYI